MKKMALGAVVLVILLAGSASQSHAWTSWHGHWPRPVFVAPHIVVGAPLVVAPPLVYPRPYVYPPVVAPYAYPAPAVVAAPPPLLPAGNPYWYYCQNPAGYYPTVPGCARGWVRVGPPR